MKLNSKITLLFIILVIVAGCHGGGGSTPPTPTRPPKVLVSIAVTPAIWTMSTGTEQFTATGNYSDNSTGDITTSVTWASSIPAVAAVTDGVVTSLATGTTMIAARLGNAAGSALLTVTGLPPATENNVLPITVNGSLCSAANSLNNGYINKPCVSITVCTPGSTTACDTINDILLDTGSYGLRIFKNLIVNASLVSVPTGTGSLANCAQFGGGTSDWGPVKKADVILGGETASNVPIQVIDSTFGTSTLPTACQNADTDPASTGFNGILGVGVFAQDCGGYCTTHSDSQMYYSCIASTCTGTTVSFANQVTNPVAKLPVDNNGVIVELQSVPSSGSVSASGLLVLGIDTQTNNASSGVTKYQTDGYGDIVTILNSVSYYSFIDSGSNGLFFTAPANGQLPDCTANPGWFCPSTVTTLTATNEDANQSMSGDVHFQIGNADTLLSSSNMVFSNIGASAPGLFDWGLPFYLGRSVYVGLYDESNPSTLPYFAY